MKAVFIIGEQRSGSNLLRVMLNEHSDITAPHPPHILSRFEPLLDHYGDLSHEATFTMLIDDVCQLVERNPISWNIKKFDRKLIKTKCHSNTLVAILGAIMEVYALYEKAQIWVCKSMQNVNWADTIQFYFTTPYFIYLYRDPRDVALSFQKAYIGDKHPYFIAKRWAARQESCLSLQQKISNKYFFSLSYESLISTPQKNLSNLCHFLGIDFQEKMLTYYLSKEASNAANAGKQWSNIQKPPLSKNTNKYLQEMSIDDIAIIEALSGPSMKKLGYSQRSTQYLPSFSTLDINQFTSQNNLLKTKIQSKFDNDSIQARNQQLNLLKDIINRNKTNFIN